VTGLVPAIVELPAAGAPAVNVTALPVTTTGDAIDTVFTSALVDAKAHVETPDASVAEQGPRLLLVPVAAKVGVVPITALLFASFKVIVIVEVAAPSAVTGVVPLIVEFPADAAPAVNVTAPPVTDTGDVIDNVFTSAFVDASVHVATPDTSVAEHAPGVLPVPVAAKVGVVPATALLFASFSVIVIVEVATPLAVTGLVPLMLELPAAAAPAWNVTVPPVTDTGDVIDSVFTSAFVDASVHVATPEASVAEHAPSVLLVPVAANAGVVHGTGEWRAGVGFMALVEVVSR